MVKIWKGRECKKDGKTVKEDKIITVYPLNKIKDGCFLPRGYRQHSELCPWAVLQIRKPHRVKEVYFMLTTSIPDPIEPEVWWGWSPKYHLGTSPPTKQNNVHKLITHLQPLSRTQSLKTFSYTLWHPWYVESIKKLYKWTYLQNRKRLTDLENELMVHSPSNYCPAQGTLLSVAAWMGGEFGEEWIHVYVRLSPFSVHPKLSQDY